MSKAKLLWIGFLILLVNTAYIAAFASPTIFYMGNVVLHLALGLVLSVAPLFVMRRFPLAGGLFLAAALAGIYLTIRGNTMDHRWALYAHIGLAGVGLAALFPHVPNRRAYSACLAVLVLFPVSVRLYQRAFPEASA